jgi:lipase chaperone LimK
LRWALAVAGGASLLLVVAVGIGRREAAGPTVPSPSAAPVTGTAPDDRRPPAPAARAPAGTPHRPRLPRSLRGTDVDGALVVDASGRFIPTSDALALFDYFFAARGEESERTIVRRIRREMRARLPPAALADALAFLDRYLAYRAGARALAEAEPDDGDLATRLAALHALRAETFGTATAERLFGAEEAYVQHALERRRIETDGALGEDERRARLAALDATLPADVRAARERALAPVRLREDEVRLRAAGGDAAAIAALREERFGAEAAARLAALDRQRAAWDRRLADYRARRLAIEADPRLSAAARAAALEALLTERFTDPERRRVEALDRLSQAPPD